MKAPNVVCVDFETHAIQARPEYPPKPVSVSIQWPKDRRPKFYAWGHPIDNTCDYGTALRALREAWDSGIPLLFQNAKFDIDVAETHMGCPRLDWSMYHDTLYLIFFADPHAISYALKPAAQRFLDMPPTEQLAVREWLVANGVVKKNDRKWGAHIANAPGILVGKYADGDVKRTLALFKHLYPLIASRGMLEAYDRERRLMPILLESERRGLRVDLDALENDCKVYQKAHAASEKWLRKRLGADDLNLDADADVAEALHNSGVVTEWDLTKTGKRSTSKSVMTIDRFADKKVFYALGYRNRLTTCLSMFMEPWLEKGSRNNGYINPTWNQVRQSKGEGNGDASGTRTGRPSCNDPNLLNVSKSFYDRGDGYDHPAFIRGLPELPLVRKYALPDRGTEWLHRDYNQQELRILAHFEDGAILAAYKADPTLDIHTFVQSEIKRLMHRDLDRVSVKTMNFGKLYGQGLGSLAAKLGVSVEEVKSIRDSQNAALPGLKELENAIKELSLSGDPIVTWGGRQYFVEPPKYVEKYGRDMTFEYKLLNYLVQGSAADVTKEAIIRYESAKKDGRFLVTVYDEINICAPKRAVKSEMKILRDMMEGIELDVPMLSDGKVGTSWGSLIKYKEER